MSTEEGNELIEEFKKLFEFKTDEEEIEHKAHMLSFRFLSEVEMEMGRIGMSRTELAKRLRTSKSYITQLFRGNKLVNLTLLARIEKALNIKFSITLTP